MKKIFLVRHGESQWNVLKKIQGQQDVPLTNRGIKQANLIGNRLVHERIDRIYSSDLKRAYDTAEIIGKRLSLNVIPTKEFREIDFGIWEGMSNDKMHIEYYNELCLWRKEPERLKVEGAESLRELQLRAMAAVNKIINNEVGDNILIVSHSATLKTIILGLLNMDLAYFKNLTLGNVSLSIVEDRDYNRVMKVLNDTCHIKES